MNMTKALLIAFAAMIVVAGSASAKVVAPDSVTGVDDKPPVVDDSGTFVSALNLGKARNRVANGVKFTGVAAKKAASVAFKNSGLTYTISTATSIVTNADLGDDLFETEIWGAGNTKSMDLLIEGLDAAKTYRIQFLHGDSRANTNYDAGVVTFTDSSNNTDNTTLTFGSQGDFAIISVEVSGSTTLKYTMPKAKRGPSYSGVAVHEIPES